MSAARKTKATRVRKPKLVDEPETTIPSDDDIPKDGVEALKQFAPDLAADIEKDDDEFCGQVAGWTEIANIPELKKYTRKRFKKQLAGLRKNCFPDRLLSFTKWTASLRSDNLRVMLWAPGLPEVFAPDMSPSDLEMYRRIKKRGAKHLLKEKTEFLDEVGDAWRKQKVGAPHRQLTKSDAEKVQLIAEDFRRLQRHGASDWRAKWDRSKGGWSLENLSHDTKRYFKEYASNAAELVLDVSGADDREGWQRWLDLLMGTQAFVWTGRYQRGKISGVCEVSADYCKLRADDEATWHLQADRMYLAGGSLDELQQGIIEDQQRRESLLEHRPEDKASIERFEKQIEIRQSRLSALKDELASSEQVETEVTPTDQVDEPRRTNSQFPNPEGLEWNEVSIEFVSNTDVKIRAREISADYHFSEMGFKDRRTSKPNKRWLTLKLCAQHNGQIDWDTLGSVANPTNLKSVVYRLRKDLKVFFGIQADPFFPYRERTAYTLRFSSIKDSTPEDSR